MAVEGIWRMPLLRLYLVRLQDTIGKVKIRARKPWNVGSCYLYLPQEDRERQGNQEEGTLAEDRSRELYWGEILIFNSGPMNEATSISTIICRPREVRS